MYDVGPVPKDLIRLSEVITLGFYFSSYFHTRTMQNLINGLTNTFDCKLYNVA